MIDEKDSSSSTLRLLVREALKSWTTKAVLKLLSDEDYIVRTAAARELHMRDDDEIFSYLEKIASSQKTYEREIGAYTLGQLATPTRVYRELSLPILIGLIKDQDSDVRAAATAALGHLYFRDMPSSVEQCLIALLDDESIDVRCCVAMSLGSASNVDLARKALAQLGKDKNTEVRSHAKLGLDLLSS